MMTHPLLLWAKLFDRWLAEVNNHRQRRWLGTMHLEGACFRCRED